MNQSLPTDDTFARNTALGASASYDGDWPTFYTHIHPWGPGFETTTGFGLGCPNNPRLHDAYQYDANKAHGYAAHSHTVNTISPGMGWSVANWINLDDVIVWMSPRLHMTVGEYTDEEVHGVGLCARVTGGTLDNADTESQVLDDVSGYFVVYTWNTGTPTFILMRLAAGVITVLTTYAPPAIVVPPGVNPYEQYLPTAMSMSAVTISGPAVAITVKRYRPRDYSAGVVSFGQGGGQGGPQWETVIAYNDTSGSRITATGACGFGSQGDDKFTLPVRHASMLVDSFKVYKASVPTEEWLDTFRRWNRWPSEPAQNTNLGVRGREIGERWTGGLWGRNSATAAADDHYNQFERNATLDEVNMGTTLTVDGTYGWYVSQRPALSNDQRRSITMDLASAGGNDNRRAGICLRTKWTSEFPVGTFEPHLGADADTLRTAYVGVIHYDHNGGTPIWTAELWSYNGVAPGDANSTPEKQLLASLVVTTGYGTMALDTDIIFDLEVATLDGDVFGLGEVQALRMRINGTVVALAAEDIDGITAESDASGRWIIDNRSASPGVPGQIRNGRGEGLFFYPDAEGSDDLIKFAAWTEQALSNPPEGDDSTQDSVVFTSETSAKSGTLTVSLSWPVTLTQEATMNRHTMETGHEVVWSRHGSNRRTWTVQASGATTAERAALLTFVGTHNGAEIPFDYTLPDALGGETVTVHFKDDGFSHTYLRPTGSGVESFKFELEELFD